MTITVKAIEKPTVFISLGDKAVEITKTEARKLYDALGKVLEISIPWCPSQDRVIYVDRIITPTYPQFPLYPQVTCGSGIGSGSGSVQSY